MTEPPPLGEDIVAQVGGVVVKAEAFEELLKQRSGSNTNLIEQKQVLLKEIIDREVLFARAKAAGLEQRADIQEAIKQILINRFREEGLIKAAAALPITDSEVESYFQAHLAQFTTPVQVHGAVIFIRVPAGLLPDAQSELLARAQSVLQEAQSATTSEGFAQIVREKSDDQTTRFRGGDFGWVTRNAPPWGMDKEVVEALFGLQTPGAFTPVIRTGKGFYILKLLELKPAKIRALAEVREAILFKLQREQKERREAEFYISLRAGLTIRTNLHVLEEIRLPAAPLMPSNAVHLK